MSFVRRTLAVLVLLLTVGSATGVFAAVAEADGSCEEDCGDGDAGCCPLVCPRCVCAARGMTAHMPGETGLPAADAVASDVPGDRTVAPESPDAGEIFHVPIVVG